MLRPSAYVALTRSPSPLVERGAEVTSATIGVTGRYA